MKVLVVDDEVGIREVIKEYCLNESYNVYEASNGLEGLGVLESENIDKTTSNTTSKQKLKKAKQGK